MALKIIPLLVVQEEEFARVVAAMDCGGVPVLSFAIGSGVLKDIVPEFESMVEIMILESSKN
jgi:hypothetical protein